ncbi:COG3650 family protein [Ferrimonas balearica]|uniref:COG3650 family protein n=1 Tax=Ferrimonas balearica TaxID=44012 RepID=UPI001C94EEC8|nr:MliC family protein [Ferrimonas balearica]MBY6223503.1 MliC family protein [Ferrimonas balearica]
MKRSRCSLAVFLTSALALTGCAGPDGAIEMVPIESAQPASQPEPVTLVMACDSVRFSARIEGETAWLFLPGETVAAKQVVSASGARYDGEGVTLWLKGEEGLLMQPDQPNQNCVNDRRAAIWEGAKLDGMDFRAVGNEPPWVLELWPETIVLKTGYEQVRQSWPRPEPTNLERASRFDLADGVSVLLEGKSCADTMVDERYETTVTVTTPERTYRGCGKALH